MTPLPEVVATSHGGELWPPGPSTETTASLLPAPVDSRMERMHATTQPAVFVELVRGAPQPTCFLFARRVLTQQRMGMLLSALQCGADADTECHAAVRGYRGESGYRGSRGYRGQRCGRLQAIEAHAHELQRRERLPWAAAVVARNWRRYVLRRRLLRFIAIRRKARCLLLRPFWALWHRNAGMYRRSRLARKRAALRAWRSYCEEYDLLLKRSLMWLHRLMHSWTEPHVTWALCKKPGPETGAHVHLQPFCAVQAPWESMHALVCCAC
jgi:hypothetical protein